MSIVTFRNVHGIETTGQYDGIMNKQTGELLVMIGNVPILVRKDQVVSIKVSEGND